ncbi:MAG TPA: ribosome biogenesis GTPase Der [Chitinophagales bacterium]|nr:ribosome biogenesis GTPase Der [Chitinophagales bacterium]
MSFTLAIVGRPNVGKSTLFNRLVGFRKAITDDLSGVTRDRQYGESEWNGREFNVIDTGGFVPHSTDIFEAAIREQVKIAIAEASLILFVVDVTTGITDLDDAITDELRRSNKPVILVVNKVDNAERLYQGAEFYGMGFEEVYFIATNSGSGTGDLLDAVVEKMPPKVDEEEEEAEALPKVAIVGQPNVGKSTLINTLIGEERNIVTDIAGTTRDSIHTYYNLYGKELLLIDTAGIRRKSRVTENLEFYSVIRAFKAIDEADICLLVIDAAVGIEAQDMAIFRQIQNKKRGVVIVVNKWDTIEKETNTLKEYQATILNKLAPFKDVPIVFVSALEKQRIHKILDKIFEVYKNSKRKIPTSKLNEMMLPEIEKHPPAAYRGNHIKIKYITQLPIRTPSFAFFSNHPEEIKKPYRGFLENRLREHFELTGVPINILMKKK